MPESDPRDDGPEPGDPEAEWPDNAPAWVVDFYDNIMAILDEHPDPTALEAARALLAYMRRLFPVPAPDPR